LTKSSRRRRRPTCGRRGRSGRSERSLRRWPQTGSWTNHIWKIVLKSKLLFSNLKVDVTNRHFDKPYLKNSFKIKSYLVWKLTLQLHKPYLKTSLNLKLFGYRWYVRLDFVRQFKLKKSFLTSTESWDILLGLYSTWKQQLSNIKLVKLNPWPKLCLINVNFN
jgi:hypothetical protein